MELFFDTETSDMLKFKKPYFDNSQPWIIQIGFILSDRDAIYQEGNLIIKADGRDIDPKAEAVHCISKEISENIGLPSKLVLEVLAHSIKRADTIVCHNTAFDIKVLLANAYMFYDSNLIQKLKDKSNLFCTMIYGTGVCKLPGRYGKYKWPKLQELHKFLFGEEFKDAHDALADVRATRRCYYEMIKEG